MSGLPVELMEKVIILAMQQQKERLERTKNKKNSRFHLNETANARLDISIVY